MAIWLTIFLTALEFLASAMTATADECRIFDDVGDKYILGNLLLDTDAKKLIANGDMTPQDLEECFSVSDDCFYKHKDGIEYIISRYYKADADPMKYPMPVGSNVLEVARVRPDFTGPLIAGIRWGDTVEDVRRKLKSLPAAFPKWQLDDHTYEGSDIDRYLLFTGSCIRSSNGAIWGYTLMFNWKGRLKGVEVRVKDYQSST